MRGLFIGVNITAQGAQSLIKSVWIKGRVQHDVIDLANIKGYRQIFNSSGASFPAHNATDGVQLASHANNPIIGTLLSNALGNGNFGFVQSFGFGQARVAAGTPARAFLVPSDTSGVLRAVDIGAPEMIGALMGLLDQRLSADIPTIPDLPSTARLIVSLTAESDGLAEVFIF